MAFRESVRRYWLKVSGDGDENNARCEWRIYTEEKGFVRCGSKDNLEVHHIITSSFLQEQGIDPDTAPAMPLCRKHHRMQFGDLPFTREGSMHPDMYGALIAYKRGDKEAFTRAAHEHHRKAQIGQRIATGDWSTDETYANYMENKAQRLAREKGLKKPNTKPPKKKHWYDDLF